MLNIQVDIRPSFSEIGKAFHAIAEGMQLQRELEKFAFRVEAESKKVSPVDTGRMRASIFTSIGTLQAKIMPNVHYAIYVHEGTRFMKARPFMKWGFDKVSANNPAAPFKARIETAINDNLK